MQNITPFLWFDHQAEQAAEFYVSVFKHATIHSVSRYGDRAPLPKGTAMTVEFNVDGLRVMALNGGPTYKLTPAFSLVVRCQTQQEIDHYWEKLAGDGGQEVRCGWVTDKFGVSWQVVPAMMGELLGGNDPARAGRVMQKLMTMQKIDIAALKAASEG